jgi:hypothetical protein
MQKQEAKNAQKELVSKIIPVLGEIAGKNNSNNDRVDTARSDRTKCLESCEVYFYQDDTFPLSNDSKILSPREKDKERIRLNQHKRLS